MALGWVVKRRAFLGLFHNGQAVQSSNFKNIRFLFSRKLKISFKNIATFSPTTDEKTVKDVKSVVFEWNGGIFSLPSNFVALLSLDAGRQCTAAAADAYVLDEAAATTVVSLACDFPVAL